MPIRRTATTLIGLAAGGAAYQTWASAQDRQNIPTSGHMVDVGGHALHYLSMGEGSPTVVIEAGLGGAGLIYYGVQKRIAEFTRVVTYDRAGLGWSEPAPGRLDGERVVSDLHTLLHRAAIPGPYVLVGHSWGGPYVRLFAQRYPEAVAGMALIDASHEEQFDRFPPSIARQTDLMAWIFWSMALGARLGILRRASGVLGLLGVWRKVPAEIRPQAQALLNRVQHWEGVSAEARDWRYTARQV
ncbi:MAG: alpha/beta fold hydrolase [Anaerolineae bacterium]|nr:alpha/beta fold hydrolase [Anaerolineae bacterium]